MPAFNLPAFAWATVDYLRTNPLVLAALIVVALGLSVELFHRAQQAHRRWLVWREYQRALREWRDWHAHHERPRLVHSRVKSIAKAKITWTERDHQFASIVAGGDPDPKEAA